MNRDRKELDFTALRERLQTAQGREYWRSLEELAKTPEFEDYLRREFPNHASVLDSGLDRRGFLGLLGASLALAGLAACTTQPLEKIVPYVRSPQDLVPGKPLFFATAMELGGEAIGLLAESHMGRPTKLEGNPLHPTSLGATDVFSQAAVLTLYDPDRSQVVLEHDRIRSWSAFKAMLPAEIDALKAGQGRGLRILVESVGSPTLGAQLTELLRLYPQARLHQWEPIHRDERLRATVLAFGRPLNFFYRFDRARIVVSLASDVFRDSLAGVRYARDFAQRRRVYDLNSPAMNRLYAIESTVTNCASMADHRLAVRPSQVEHLARHLLKAVKSGRAASPGLEDRSLAWIDAVARDLLRHPGESLVVAGEHQPAAVQAIAHQINGLLGNLGETVLLTEPGVSQTTANLESLAELVADMSDGQVDTLVVVGANPAFTAPADIDFKGNVSRARLKIHLGLYVDETAELCDWHIPEAHFLESWSDARAYDGTASIVQPLIEPLFSGKSRHELIALLLGDNRSAYDIVRGHWMKQSQEKDFETFWARVLHDGVIPRTQFPTVRAVPVLSRTEGDDRDNAAKEGEDEGGENSLEVLFRPDPGLHDGRFANNAWLQELPKPITKLTWENAILMSPRTAERLSADNNDVVELEYSGRKVSGPVWIVPGHADGCATVHLGYGRRRTGRVGTGTGFDPYRIRPREHQWQLNGVSFRRTGKRRSLASTQNHWSLEGRDIVRSGTLSELLGKRHSPPPHESKSPHPTLYPKVEETSANAWGMVINLSACLGCNACVVACQAENNVPVVGREGVLRQREMHWLRVDRYFKGSLDQPEIVHQPMLCQHCERAPCEVVCPVGATVHSAEGLNEMVYNRCVGTRYCSNNCPYKVRRFNFLQYSDHQPLSQLSHNPDVTVRNRGVMEKCTFCVQRISAARIEAKKEDRPIREGEVVTACQAACPTQAIVFGDVNNVDSEVSKLRGLPINYSVLGELNTVPRVTYLAALRNPNPELES